MFTRLKSCSKNLLNRQQIKLTHSYENLISYTGLKLRDTYLASRWHLDLIIAPRDSLLVFKLVGTLLVSGWHFPLIGVLQGFLTGL